MKKALLALVIIFMGCGSISKNNKTQQTDERKPFNISVGFGALNLSSGSVDITSVTGHFSGCNDPQWTIPGSFGTVYASVSCESAIYESIDIVEGDGEPVTLGLDSADVYEDSQGNEWRFISSDDNPSRPTLYANFNRAIDGEITIKNKEFNMAVRIDAGDGAICNPNNPFTISATELNTIHVKLNPPANGLPEGVEFFIEGDDEPVDHPEIHINGPKKRFEMDFYNRKPKVFEYSTELIARKGRSECKVKSLRINLEAEEAAAFPKPGPIPQCLSFVDNDVSNQCGAAYDELSVIDQSESQILLQARSGDDPVNTVVLKIEAAAPATIAIHDDVALRLAIPSDAHQQKLITVTVLDHAGAKQRIKRVSFQPKLIQADPNRDGNPYFQVYPGGLARAQIDPTGYNGQVYDYMNAPPIQDELKFAIWNALEIELNLLTFELAQ